MAAVQFINFYNSELAAPVAPTDTSIQVSSITASTGETLASLITGGNWIYLSLIDANSWNNNLVPPQTYEVVKVTAVSGSTSPFTLTVTRAQDHTTAQTFSKCDIAAWLVNAQSLYDISTSPGSGTVTSVAAAAPITATPSNPITTTGTIGITDFVASGASHARGSVPDPGAVAGTTKFLREDATWAVPAGGGGSVSITATTPIVVTPSPLTGTGVVSHATTAVTPATYGDSTHVAQFTVNSTGHLTFAGNVALSAGGTLQSQEFTASGTFNVPTNVTGVWVTGIGGGGGGGTRASALGGGGGGSGEYGQLLPLNVTSSGTLTITVGTGGAGAPATSGAADGSSGNNSVVGPYTFLGGKGGDGASNGIGGAGAGPNGGAGGTGNVSPGTMGTIESSSYFGGGGGGGGGTTTTMNGTAGCPGPGNLTGAAGGTNGSTQAGGGGGASSLYGLGGVGGNGGLAGTSATSGSPTSGGVPGSGGGGAGGLTGSNAAGGNGANGYVLIMWVS